MLARVCVSYPWSPAFGRAPQKILSLRRFGDDQIVTLAKLVIENAPPSRS